MQRKLQMESKAESVLDEKMKAIKADFEASIEKELKKRREMPTCIEIKEPYALENNEPVYFKAEGGSHTFFHF